MWLWSCTLKYIDIIIMLFETDNQWTIISPKAQHNEQMIKIYETMKLYLQTSAET